MQTARTQDDGSVIDEIPDEVLDRLPPETVDRLRDGVIDQIPEELYDQLPPSVQARIPDSLVDFASSNPTLAAILAIIGIISIVGFFYGVAKSAMKAAVFFAVIGALAWYFFAQQV